MTELDVTALTVRRNDDHGRYELMDGDRVIGFAEFRSHSDRTVVLPHTVIDAQLRGHGLGDVLVRGALADLRARGVGIVPACWFVADYLQRHPDEEPIAPA